MSEYDSILKEKKVYSEEVVSVKKKRRRKIFFLDFLVVIFILIGSYIYYYNNILSGSNVFLYDIDYLLGKGRCILEPLSIDLSDGGRGNIVFDNYRYDYEFGYNDSKYYLMLSHDKENASYYYDGNRFYSKFSNFMNGSWVEKGDSYPRSKTDDVLNKNDFIKKFYFDGGTPIVEVNYSINQDSFNKLLGFSLFKDEIDFIFTFKNHAVTNEFMNGKIIINNKSKKRRDLVEYKEGNIVLTMDNGKVVSFHLVSKDDNFTLKISKDNVLYSVFSGTKKDDNYVYSYQVIDKIFNLSFNTYTKGNEKIIDFVSNVEKDGSVIKKSANIVLGSNSFNNGISINGKVAGNTFNKGNQDKYKEVSSQFFLPIREFVLEYKDGID